MIFKSLSQEEEEEEEAQQRGRPSDLLFAGKKKKNSKKNLCLKKNRTRISSEDLTNLMFVYFNGIIHYLPCSGK